MIAPFMTALDKEQAEFVRPALVRALASLAAGAPSDQVTGARQALVREVSRGEDFFRSAVIEALGDYKAQYAFDALVAVAKLDGPLQDDAALALGKIGDKRALDTLAGIQRTAPRPAQPAIATAICLLGVNCESHESYLVETLKFSDKNPGFQELLRGAAGGLAALAVAGHIEAAQALVDVGVPSRDPTRAPLSLALATVALRNTPLCVTMLEKHPHRDDAIVLLAEGFDMLEEDLDKERFFAATRRAYLGVAGQLAAPGVDADAHRQAGLLIVLARCRAGLSRLPEYTWSTKQRALTSTPETKPSGVSGNWRGGRSRPASCRRSDRSAGCFVSIASVIGIRCWYRAPTASARSSRSRS